VGRTVRSIRVRSALAEFEDRSRPIIPGVAFDRTEKLPLLLAAKYAGPGTATVIGVGVNQSSRVPGSDVAI